MTARTPAARGAAAVLLALLVPLAGCGDEGGGGDGGGGRKGPATGSSAPDPVPTASRPPEPGKGTKDPDDLNGDGHRDLVLTVPVAKPGSQGTETRLAVVFGSAGGLDPTRRTLYGRPDLGLPTDEGVNQGESPAGVRSVGPVTTADLDGDGFPDVVTQTAVHLSDEEARRTGAPMEYRSDTYVTWGGPSGPRRGTKAVRLRLPAPAAAQGLTLVRRGDFDGDGHHDLAGVRQDGRELVVLHGPFARSGAPARTDTRSLPEDQDVAYGTLRVDDIAASGRPRATGLLVHFGDDGEQAGGLLFAAVDGGSGDGARGIAAAGRPVRAGNAFAFGDFDGDGARDLAVGDSGSRNDEPGYETEPPDVDGSYAVYSGKGGAPAVQRLPKSGESGQSTTSSRAFFAADPDGDGKDGLLVAGPEQVPTAVLLDGDKESARLTRSGPATLDGARIPADDRRTSVTATGDFDGDGADETVVTWATRTLDGTYGTVPVQWWITKGLTDQDQLTFSTRKFAPVPRSAE
ncbi:hypothetical protein [Streptomyces sp. NPDC059009]|uniref:hypothetical protein n=1 Tax=Streptomyces sp. NPDC059009 TaxID=3346694 RepID=UPI0036B0AE8E